MSQRPLLPDEQPPEAHVAPQTFHETGDKAGTVAPESTKVGWTLRRNGKITAGFAFLINPQGITRGLGTRATVFSTKAANYVDDFGPAPGAISIRQLVASGKVDGDVFFTAREDIQRFLKTIWIPATTAPRGQRPTVYFHDNHFERGFEERVYFPPEGLSITRDVELHNVWRFELQMVGLERNPYGGDIKVQTSPVPARGGLRYKVKKGDTLEKLVRRLAGKHASKAKLKRVRARLLELNPFLKKKRKLADGHMGRAYILHAGEILTLPK